MRERLVKHIKICWEITKKCDVEDVHVGTRRERRRKKKSKLDIFVALLSSPTLFPNPITSMGTQLHFKVAKPPATTSNSARRLNQKIKWTAAPLFKYSAKKGPMYFFCVGVFVWNKTQRHQNGLIFQVFKLIILIYISEEIQRFPRQIDTHRLASAFAEFSILRHFLYPEYPELLFL